MFGYYRLLLVLSMSKNVHNKQEECIILLFCLSVTVGMYFIPKIHFNTYLFVVNYKVQQ